MSPLRLLPVNAITSSRGIIVSRGRTAVEITSQDALSHFRLIANASLNDRGFMVEELSGAIEPSGRLAFDIVVEALTAQGLLVPIKTYDRIAPKSINANEAVFYWDHGIPPVSARDRLSDKRIAILGENTLSDLLADALTELGCSTIIRVSNPLFDCPDQEKSHKAVELDTAPDILVACSDFGGLALMREWNEWCFDNDITFLPLVLQSYIGYIGPMTVGQSAGCFECFWTRQSSLLPSPEIRGLETTSPLARKSSGHLPGMVRTLADFAAMELVKYLTSLSTLTIGGVIEVDMLQPSIGQRKILRAPRCPVCSLARHMPSVEVEKKPLQVSSDVSD